MTWRIALFGSALVGFALSGCGGGETALDSGAADGGTDAAIPSGPTHLERLESVADYQMLEAEGREVKYLTQVDGREPVLPAECLFQNTARFPYHVQFLRDTFEELSTLNFDEYVSLVLRANSRRFWGGGLRPYDNITHPITGAAGIYVYSVYQENGSGELLSVAQLTELDQRLARCAPFAAERLVFVPGSSEQEARVRTILDDLTAAGVAVRFQDQLIERNYEAYSAQEGYGYLHVVPQGEELGVDYGPRDVVVVSAAPSDISIVAGLISALPQNVHSHVNLRMREKDLPNAMLANIYEDPRIASLRDQLVHIVAGETSLTLEAATLDDAQAYWDAHRPNVGTVRSDLSITALERMDTLEHSDAIAYGVKAANLGELHSILPAENRVEGFAIPFSAYRDFVVQNGIDQEVAALLADPRIRTDRAYRDAELDDLRKSIRRGEVNAEFFTALTNQLRAVFGSEVDTTYIRFRSSTNAEDLEGLSGAGLYDSNSGCLADDLDADAAGPSRCLSSDHRTHLENELARRRQELIDHPENTWVAAIVEDIEGDLADEKPVADALRKVWRSLWNLRAFDEREYYGIPHDQVFMGIAVQPTFVMEQRESVVVTNLMLDAGDPVYRVVSQVGEIGVVRPIDPRAVAESITFRRTASGMGDVRTVVPSSLSLGGARLWSDAELQTLSSLLFQIQDRFSSTVYPDIENLRLDLEVEVTHDDRIVIKQARPYIGES